ncbi:MAG: hypothetical protein ACKVZH_00270, partial [Blastocatellia bacterium]
QQPVSPEKKRAMNKLDPVDIYPQLQERSGRERNRNKQASNSADTTQPNLSSESGTSANSNRNSRRHSAKKSLPAELAITATPAPAIAPPEPVATASPDSSVALGIAANAQSTLPPQTMTALGNLPSSDNQRNTLLSLPIILALLVLVLIALVFAFAKLIRYLRGSSV